MGAERTRRREWELRWELQCALDRPAAGGDGSAAALDRPAAGGDGSGVGSVATAETALVTTALPVAATVVMTASRARGSTSHQAATPLSEPADRPSAWQCRRLI